MTNQEQLTLDELRQAVDAAGLQLVTKSHGHYQVVGQLTVNYWPFSKARTTHVKDSKLSHKGCDIAEVIRIAQREPKENPLRPAETPEPLNPAFKPGYGGNAPW